MDKKQKATLRYASTAPSKEQILKIKNVLMSKLGQDDIDLECIHDPEVGGGFIVSCGNYEYDWSDKGRAKQLRSQLGNVRSGNIISMLKHNTLR